MKLIELTDEQYRDLKPGLDALGCTMVVTRPEYEACECPHCGRYDDWSDIEWDDPCGYELEAWARCPECDGLHNLVFTLTHNIPVRDEED